MWNSIYNFLVSNRFLNSTFFLGCVTLLVGGLALYLYRKAKRDEQAYAAVILLAEIKSVVTILPGLKARFKDDKYRTMNEDILLLPSESWNKYKYLFVKSLKSEEWQALDQFFKFSIAFDDAIRENRSYFAQNAGQIWVSIHKNYYESLREFFGSGAELIDDSNSAGAILVDEDTAKKISQFTYTYIGNTIRLAGYTPSKPITDAGNAIENINNDILISSVGSHLQAIADGRTRLIARIFYRSR